MKKDFIIKILIAVVAVIVVGVVAFAVSTKVINSEEPTTQSSELVAPAVGVPTGSNSENEADSTQSWNETETLVQGIEMETTVPEMPDVLPGEVVTLGEAKTIDAADVKPNDRPLLVLNAKNKISADYLPYLEEAISGSGIYLEAAAAKAFMEMYTVALGQVLTLTPAVGYVSIDRQQKQYEALAEEYVGMGYSQKEAEALAAKKILPPGCSEHNAGLAVDFTSKYKNFEDSAEYKWLVRNAAAFGFIERYTSDFESETGVDAKTSHWRYVGSAALAKEILASGLSFDEWMEYEYPYWVEPEEETEEDIIETEETEEDESATETEEESATDSEEATEESTTEQATTEQVIIDLDAQ